jgi:hypothetical protein
METWGQKGCFRIILPETVAEFEQWSFEIRKTSRLSSSVGPTGLDKGLPAQLVEATLSNSLIQPRFPERTDLSGSTQSEPSQGSAPFDSILGSDFSL